MRRSLWFESPRHVRVREGAVPAPGAGEVLVETVVSAISPGTEMLVYRGELPQGIAVDETIAALGGDFAYPLRYGYAAVGRVVAVGSGVDETWLGRAVFAFHPHESHFVADPAALVELPSDIPLERAAFLPNAETALSLVMDGRPAVGERIVVFGQGVVGLLTTALLASLLPAALVALDRYPLRRSWGERLGAGQVLDPAAADAGAVRAALADAAANRVEVDGADLVYELSGNPRALQQAIDVTGFGGRVVVGSWYGEKDVSLALGGHFHRGHLQLISSQVSRLAPAWQARWTKARRLAVALSLLERLQPERLVTHRFPLEQAEAAYRLLDDQPDAAVQLLLTYGQ